MSDIKMLGHKPAFLFVIRNVRPRNNPMNSPPMSTDQMVDHLTKEWNEVTLAAFHKEAQQQPSRIALKSLRLPGGPRLVLMICIATPEHVEAFRKILGFDFSVHTHSDWAATPISILFRDTVQAGGLQYEILRDHLEMPSALVLSAADPVSIKKLSGMFDLPK